MHLYQLTTEYQSAFMRMAESEFDEQTIADTLEGMEGEIVAKAQNVLAYALNRKAEAKALKDGPLASIQARIRRAENEAEWMEDYLKRNMAAAGITEIRALDDSFIAKLHIGRDSAVVIDDVDAIPIDYMREVPATLQPDKATIKKAIAEGFDVPGARLEKRDRLEVK